MGELDKEIVKLKLNFVAVKNDLAFFLQFLDVLINTKFGNCADGGWRNFQSNPFTCFRYEKLFGVKVRIKPTLRFTVWVRNIITTNWAFPSQVTYFRHVNKIECSNWNNFQEMSAQKWNTQTLQNCGDSERTRTSNLLIRSQMLYPLSYGAYAFVFGLQR